MELLVGDGTVKECEIQLLILSAYSLYRVTQFHFDSESPPSHYIQLKQKLNLIFSELASKTVYLWDWGGNGALEGRDLG